MKYSNDYDNLIELYKTTTEKIDKLEKDQKELLEVLKELFESLKGITGAWAPNSPYGKAAIVLENMGDIGYEMV